MSTDSIMNAFSPSAATTRTVPRGSPGVVTYRHQHEKGSEMAYVALADSHEEAQVAATHALASLAGVDPHCLVFTITIRYRKTNERQEITIAPGAWHYVTSRLVPYRLIDVHVVPTVPQPPPPSPSKSQAQVPPYPDSPPPRYPGTPHKHAPLPPEGQGYGYGYGFSWHDQIGPESNGAGYQLDPSEMADQRSMGWSASSVKVNHSRRGGTGLFGRFRQNGFGIFPITWNDQPEERMRRRGKGTTRRRREKERQREKEEEREWERALQKMQDQHEEASRSGHSYVPSLI